MAHIDLSNTIVIMKPVGAESLRALDTQHNHNRLESFHFEQSIGEKVTYDNVRSRECTPYFARPPETGLLLKLNLAPMVPASGFVFGRDQRSCDICLEENPDPKAKYGISARHFRINFNFKSGILLLYNESSVGTGFSAPSANKDYTFLRKKDCHSLIRGEQSKIFVGRLVYELSFPDLSKHQDEYSRNVQLYLQKHALDLTAIGALGIRSLSSTPYIAHRKGRYSDYILHNKIGAGAFGKVYKASNDSGNVFAAKEFSDAAFKETAILEKIKHVRHSPELTIALTDSRTTL